VNSKIKFSVIVAAVLSLILANACSTGEGWVKVDGNKFVDPKGNELIFRGLCFSDPVKLVREGQWNERYFAAAADWGANVVRFAVHPSNINSLGWEETFQAMDRGIEWAKQYGSYVIMDWHSIGNLKEERYTSPMYNTTKEETFKFWRTVAQRYKDEPQVALYELFNEPTVNGTGPCTWTEWKELQEQIIDTVRTYNPNALCLCAGFNWAYDLTPVAEEPIARPNVAYVSHPYPMKRPEPWEEQWERDFGFVADTYPVICTEIGYCLEDEPGAHVPVMSTDVYGEHITRYFEQKGISFTVWCFDTSWAPMLISDWDFTPTTQGRFFKAYLQSKAQ
jgi:aryl-phospho-beta-D-glucosidase BglC (GH1 family)